MPKINLRFRNRRFLGRGLTRAEIHIAASAQTARSQRQDIDTFHQRVQIRWISIGVIDAEDCLIRNKDAHARIAENVLLRLCLRSARRLLLLLSGDLTLLLLDCLHRRSDQRFAMKLIDGFAHFAQGRAQLFLFLSLDGNLDERDDAQRENGEHGDRNHQFDQCESGLPLTIKHHLPAIGVSSRNQVSQQMPRR